MLLPLVSCLFFLRWSGNPAVFPHPPEVYNHKDCCKQRKCDAVKDVEAKQCRRSNLRTAKQKKTNVVIRFHHKLGSERTLMPEEWRCTCHIRSNCNCPHGKLIPR